MVRGISFALNYGHGMKLALMFESDMYGQDGQGEKRVR